MHNICLTMLSRTIFFQKLNRNVLQPWVAIVSFLKKYLLCLKWTWLLSRSVKASFKTAVVRRNTFIQKHFVVWQFSEQLSVLPAIWEVSFAMEYRRSWKVKEILTQWKLVLPSLANMYLQFSLELLLCTGLMKTNTKSLLVLYRNQRMLMAKTRN